MKKQLYAIALFAFASAQIFAAGTTENSWEEIADFGEIVPEKGEYLVLASKKSFDDPEWKKAIKTLWKRYSAKVLLWENSVSERENQIKKIAPRYIALVAKPDEIDRNTVAEMHRISRKIDPDFFGDAIFGIISGFDGNAVNRLVEKQNSPLILERAIGTTNFDQERFRKSFFITDWGAREFVETKNGIRGEKTAVPAGKDVAIFFAENWEKIHPQFVISSSHATEYNLEMPFGKGLLASAGDKFFIFEQTQIPEFLKRLGNAEEVKKFAEEKKFQSLNAGENPKVWIAAGNCLFGDTLRDKNSMAITAISAANVRQLVGYTVPSWFGEGGWGTLSEFFDGNQNTTVSQAWFLNNQRILNALPSSLRKAEIPMNPADRTGMEPAVAWKIVAQSGEKVTKENVGRVYDRDVVAFYGDPLFRTSFVDDLPSSQPWNCTLEKRGNERKLTISGTKNRSRKGKFSFWFPEICDTETPLKFTKISRGNAEEISPKHVFTKNFLLFLEPIEIAPEEKISVEYSVKK